MIIVMKIHIQSESLRYVFSLMDILYTFLDDYIGNIQ